APLRLVAALHGDEGGDRVCLVREEDVVARRDDQQREGDREQHQACDDETARAEGSHNKPREMPPSTRRGTPFTYDARLEARKHTTSPNSRGVPSRPSGICASSSGDGPSSP